jgi:hypothetical protein
LSDHWRIIRTTRPPSGRLTSLRPALVSYPLWSFAMDLVRRTSKVSDYNGFVPVRHATGPRGCDVWEDRRSNQLGVAYSRTVRFSCLECESAKKNVMMDTGVLDVRQKSWSLGLIARAPRRQSGHFGARAFTGSENKYITIRCNMQPFDI